jgi:predicted permease
MVFIKLVVIPLLVFLSVALLRKVHWISLDPCLALVLLLCDVGPTAINMLVIAAVHGVFERVITTLHFYAYLVSNITTTLWVICFLLCIHNM